MTLSHWLAAAMALALAVLLGLAAEWAFTEVPPATQFSDEVPQTPLQAAATTTPSRTEAVDEPVIALPELVPEIAIPPVPLPPARTVEELNQTIGLLRGALVNIICVPSKKTLDSVSGTGVVIDPRGIILTVAHVGQYFLLDDYAKNRVSCRIRTGSPAENAYTAEALYVSPTWLTNNIGIITGDASGGTGEHDYALVGITGSATAKKLPDVFPAVPLSPVAVDIDANESVAVASYGAEFLTSKQISAALYQSIVFGTVAGLYTYSSNVLDLITLNLGAVAQDGSSGGVVANSDDELIGLITTRSSKEVVSARMLNAITANHIRRSFMEETGYLLDDYLREQSVPELIDAFQEEKEELADRIDDAL